MDININDVNYEVSSMICCGIGLLFVHFKTMTAYHIYLDFQLFMPYDIAKWLALVFCFENFMSIALHLYINGVIGGICPQIESKTLPFLAQYEKRRVCPC